MALDKIQVVDSDHTAGKALLRDVTSDMMEPVRGDLTVFAETQSASDERIVAWFMGEAYNFAKNQFSAIIAKARRAAEADGKEIVIGKESRLNAGEITVLARYRWSGGKPSHQFVGKIVEAWQKTRYEELKASFRPEMVADRGEFDPCEAFRIALAEEINRQRLDAADQSQKQWFKLLLAVVVVIRGRGHEVKKEGKYVGPRVIYARKDKRRRDSNFIPKVVATFDGKRKLAQKDVWDALLFYGYVDSSLLVDGTCRLSTGFPSTPVWRLSPDAMMDWILQEDFVSKVRGVAVELQAKADAKKRRRAAASKKEGAFLVAQGHLSRAGVKTIEDLEEPLDMFGVDSSIVSALDIKAVEAIMALGFYLESNGRPPKRKKKKRKQKTGESDEPKAESLTEDSEDASAGDGETGSTSSAAA